jgi:hypothetical protein
VTLARTGQAGILLARTVYVGALPTCQVCISRICIQVVLVCVPAEQYRSISLSYIRGAVAVVLAYDISDPSRECDVNENVKVWLVLRQRKSALPLFLLPRQPRCFLILGMSRPGPKIYACWSRLLASLWWAARQILSHQS